MTEQERRLSNVILFGQVEELDAKRARVRVRAGEILTAWLPCMTTRACEDRTWHIYEPGEQVVLAAPGGDLNQAVVLGACYRKAYPAPASSENVARFIFRDGAVMEYDREAHVLSATIPGDVVIKATGNVEVQAESRISLTSPNIDLNGVIMLNGPVIQGGGSNGGNAQLNGWLHVAKTITTDADVVAEVSLNHHTHGCPDGGTGGPK
jgi:phage baseplate assembly protein V